MALLTETCQQHEICQLIRGMFGNRPGSHYTAMLQAYFDESGHPTDSSVVSVAAVVAPEESWGRFEDEWQAVLDRYHVKGLHMKHYAHFRGEFHEWTEDKRKQFVLELLPILKAHACFGFGCSLPMADWNAVMGDRFPTPLMMLFRCCLDAIQLTPMLPQDEEVLCLFEWNNEIIDEASKTFKDWNDEFRQGHRFHGFGFAKKGKSHALEIADLLAYEGRKHLSEWVQQTGRPTRKLYQSLNASPQFHFWSITQEGLQSYLDAEFPGI